MIRPLLATAVLVPLAFAGLAAAQTAVPVPAFKSVGLEGGGHVVIKYGAVQSVTILKGSTQYTKISTRDSSLKIDACNNDCPEHYDLEIEIVTPDLASVAISGGGHIESQGDFPHQDAITAAVDGGGHIDLRSISAATATAAVDGGGNIQVKAEKHLTAAVDGGGKIVYWGNPEVTQEIDGGGSVSRGDKD